MPSNDREFFNAWAGKDGVYKVYPDAEYLHILDETGILAEDRDRKVMEAGCGSGAFSFFLADQGFSDITAMDISDGLIEAGRARGRKGIRFFVGDILRSPFEAGSFDIIFCGAVLHHLPDKLPEVAAEFARVLKPGGKVYFFEPYSPSINSFLWYHVFSFNRTCEERALAPAEVSAAFSAAGFGGFACRKLVGVKHLMPAERSALGRLVAALRRFVSEHLLPNTFFAGSCSKTAPEKK